jgi:hypothetical protein
MDATVPFSYVAGFIINCGYVLADVVSFEVKNDRIIWSLKVTQDGEVLGLRKVEQLIVREPPPVTGGSDIRLDVSEQMGIHTNVTTEGNGD